MNLPNKLTVIRAAVVPVFVFFLLGRELFGPNYLWLADWIALFIFIAASLTDLFDGKLARKYNLVTNFGKFMDPLADKLLVCSALICLVHLGRLWAWIAIIIIAREFIISGFRLIASDQGIVIAASMWGKVKTVIQMVMIGFLIGAPTLCEFLETLTPYSAAFHVIALIFTWVTWILVAVALALTIISLIDYISKNRQVLKTVGEQDK
ncbi:MAG: CDP-diacylglycerol--glycerol-3-phosphate 3-phosphatidyltransferase [Lachnospiraceae bacterium]|nr:CDP-diacylglycerol--glycerol-3-phosphate 3-phosphatidyltransferase [Lachnospiraceae bacterium]